MALYIPDHELSEAKKVISKLGDSREDQLIRYFIEKKDDHIKLQSEELERYREWFKQLDHFLPNNNPIFG